MKNPNLYSVRDVVANEFCAPLLLKNNDNAVRWFENQYKDNPEKGLVRTDFEIYCIGEFNPDTGFIVPVEPTRIDSVLPLSEKVE